MSVTIPHPGLLPEGEGIIGNMLVAIPSDQRERMTAERKPKRRRSEGPQKKRWTVRIGVATSCVVVLVLCSAHFDQMFSGGHLGYAGALRGVMGINMSRFDRVAPLENGGPTFNSPPIVRFNHPPLTALLVGSAFALFGEQSERVARLVPISASVLTVLLFFFAFRRLFSPGVALVFCLIWSVAPLVVLYGAMVSYEPFVLCFWAFFLWSRVRWHQKRQKKDLVFGALAICLGVWTDWPMVLLVSGAIVVEFFRTFKEKKRGFLRMVCLSLAGAVVILAFVYFFFWNVRTENLIDLYRLRSSYGDLHLFDVFGHIAIRSSLILTLPVVLVGTLGLGGLAKNHKALLIELFVPPLLLLVLLPQHAVIHCFSAWYLLPAFVLGSSWALFEVGQRVRKRFGAISVVVCVGLFAGVYFYSASLVIADGWVSDGSPFEARPRISYRHLALAKWIRGATEPEDILIIDPSTRITGVRAWFLHRRQVIRTKIRPENLLKSLPNSVALLSRRNHSSQQIRDLMKQYPAMIFEDVLVIDSRRRSKEVRVFELVEKRASWFWTVARSALYPPHQWTERAPGRAALYRLQLFDQQPQNDKLISTLPGGASLAEWAARSMLAGDRPERLSFERAIESSLTVHHPEEPEICDDLIWVGLRADETDFGRVGLRLAFKTRRELDGLPRLRATLMPEKSSKAVGSWKVSPDDSFVFPPSSYVISSTWLTDKNRRIRSGQYEVAIRGCGGQSEKLRVSLRPKTALPSLERLGIL